MSVMNDEGLSVSVDEGEAEVAWVGLDANGQLTDTGRRGGEPGPRLSDGDLLSRFER